MDRLLYVAMTGARENSTSQATAANNLANASTNGFKADFVQARALPVFGEGLPSRAFVMTERPASNLASGTVSNTGGALDVAIKGDGFFAVRDAEGREAYTRTGKLQLNGAGNLLTASGQVVLGAGGPITLPPFEKIEFGKDGTVSIRPQGAPGNALVIVDQLKVVLPERKNVLKGEDGLFRQTSGQPAPVHPAPEVIGQALENSNVNTVNELVGLLSQARGYEVSVKMMRVAEQNDSALERLIQI